MITLNLIHCFPKKSPSWMIDSENNPIINLPNDNNQNWNDNNFYDVGVRTKREENDESMMDSLVIKGTNLRKPFLF